MFSAHVIVLQVGSFLGLAFSITRLAIFVRDERSVGGATGATVWAVLDVDGDLGPDVPAVRWAGRMVTTATWWATTRACVKP